MQINQDQIRSLENRERKALGALHRFEHVKSGALGAAPEEFTQGRLVFHDEDTSVRGPHVPMVRRQPDEGTQRSGKSVLALRRGCAFTWD